MVSRGERTKQDRRGHGLETHSGHEEEGKPHFLQHRGENAVYGCVYIPGRDLEVYPAMKKKESLVSPLIIYPINININNSKIMCFNKHGYIHAIVYNSLYYQH